MSSKKSGNELVKLARKHRVTSSVTDVAIFDTLSALDTPRSLTVWLLFSRGEHQQLVDLDIDPLNYNSKAQFRDDYTATYLLSKSTFLKIDVKKDVAAYAKFFKFEEHCKSVNRRFKSALSDPLNKGQNVWLLNATKRKIAQILTDFTPDEFVDSANWGPGVTTKISGEHVSATNKFHSENGITRDLASFVAPWFSMAFPRWSEHLVSQHGDEWFDYQRGNKIITVPKNSKTDRVIAIEPGLNLYFQKGIGKMIRRRMARIGVDLNDQTINQRYAHDGSNSGMIATIDFSSASDSISLEVVRELIPHKWLQLMELTRSTVGIHNDQVIKWEKFSSMGNGYTWELESLIFYAAAKAVAELLEAEGPISVYGDDVIIPSNCCELYSSFCEYLGFLVNKSKSFSTSYFRESCGSHYFDGLDCKPLFLKERLRNVQSIYKLANGIRRLAHRHNSYCGCAVRFQDTWSHLFSRVPANLRFAVTDGIGDCGFIMNFDESTPCLAGRGFEGYRVSALIELGLTQYFEGTGMLLARLRQPSQLEYGNNYTLRGRTKLKVHLILVPRWYNLGEWI